jgi:hypothetical protein
MDLDPEWSMWKCVACNAPLCAVECTACGGAYITLWTNCATCRQCDNDWSTNVQAITVEQLRDKAANQGSR